MQYFKFIPINESSLLISFGDVIHEEVHAHVMLAKSAIEANPFPGFVETVPAYTTLAVYYDPTKVESALETISATVIETLEILLASATANQATTINRIIELPVCYDNEFAADLIETAEHLQLTSEELISIHNTKTYKVFMLGFTPGFPYMGTVNERIFTQRKQQPRLKIEPGSVAIAGNQTGIYPFATPGGWNIIGRTPLLLFDRNRSNPFLLKAGDEVKFKQISKEEFETLSAVVNPDSGLS
jgi:inhibitor of KinA